MDKFKYFNEFLGSQNIQISITGFVVNLLLVSLLTTLLSLIYTKFGNSLSNRKGFSNNFVLIGTATMIIITIVKSSLALSLGLVGALSIVRFRAAIKEPEELTYIFITIAIGLGMGADLRLITLLGFAFMALVIILKKQYSEKEESSNLFLSINSSQAQSIDIQKIIEILKLNCSKVDLRRYDIKNNNLEASFQIELTDANKLKDTQSALLALDPSIGIGFMDNKHLY